jgi:phage terminase large subunit
MDGQIEAMISQLSPIDIRAQLFKNRDFDFIVKQEANGEVKEHKKQRQALEILTSNKYSEFLYGGGAGSAKSWTGCVWLLFMGINYPGTRYFVARNELKALEESVLVTFHKVCKAYGYSDYKYNAVKHYITLGNGSVINFVEIKRQPSDPLFETLGSTEYTAGWIEEVGEIDETGAQVLSKRAGRHMNDKYGINKIIFYTCNPKKNWAKREFYDKWKKGELEDFKCYLPALVLDNPFIEKSYAKDLESYKTTNKVLYERLYKGNWDYEDNPYQLTDYEMIDAMFTNNHVNKDINGNQIKAKRYITADVAGMGSDSARIGYWEGWELKEVISFDKSTSTDIEMAIRTLQFKYKVAKPRCIADYDGMGFGVVHGTGIKAFRNNARPIQKGREVANFKNLQVQCLYYLAEKINNAEINISADLTSTEIEQIKEEMTQIQSKGDHDPERKLDCKSKADIKDSIGRSPDWRDMMLMRSYFDLKKTTADLTTTWN